MTTRALRTRRPLAQFATVCLLAAALSLVMLPATAANNRLPNGQRLYAGECISDPGGSEYPTAKFCVWRYSRISLYYGQRCWTWQASDKRYRPGAYVRVASNGDVGFLTGGGTRMWHSGTKYYPGADLVVGSSRVYLNARLAVDTGTAFFTFKSCR